MNSGPYFLLLFFQAFCWVDLSAQTEPHRLSIPVFGYIKSSEWGNGYGIGLGLQYNDHEIGGFYRNERFIGAGGGLYYRWYLPKTNILCRPYLTITGEKNHRDALLLSGNRKYSADILGLWGALGVQFRIAKSFQLFGAIGGGVESVKIKELNIGGAGLTGSFNFGLRYDLRVLGGRDTTWSLSSSYDGKERLSLAFRIGFFKDQPFGENFNFYPSIEVRANRILHPYVGLFVGGIEQERPFKRKQDYMLKGIGAGLRFYTMTKPRIAVYQEVGYLHSRMLRWNHYGSRVLVGNVFSYKIVPGLHVLAGMYLNFLRYDHYFEASIGVRIDPVRWFRKISNSSRTLKNPSIRYNLNTSSNQGAFLYCVLDLGV